MQESVGHFSVLSCQLDLCEVVSGTGILSVASQGMIQTRGMQKLQELWVLNH